MIKNTITSILAFASTNIDDIFILMLFYGSKRFKPMQIMVGQYVGIGTLVVLSFIGSFIGSFFDGRYVGLLGIFPICLAIKHIMGSLNFKNEDEIEQLKMKKVSFIAVAGVTIANGADNIGVYAPLLSTQSNIEKLELIIVFLVMTFLWCWIAKYLADHPIIAKQLDKYGHVIMPVVLFALGVFIILESNSLSLLW